MVIDVEGAGKLIFFDIFGSHLVSTVRFAVVSGSLTAIHGQRRPFSRWENKNCLLGENMFVFLASTGVVAMLQ